MTNLLSVLAIITIVLGGMTLMSNSSPSKQTGGTRRKIRKSHKKSRRH